VFCAAMGINSITGKTAEMNPRLEITPAGIKFYSPYDPDLVASLKQQIPAVARKWDGQGKFWLVGLQYENALVNLCEFHFDTLPIITRSLFGTKSQTEQRLLRVEYIGGLKDRGNGELTALGGSTVSVTIGTKFPVTASAVNWIYVFSESVLREWFEGNKGVNSAPSATTLYTLLNTKPNAPGAELKKAWREQLRRYHPDVNKDSDAHEMTIKITEAYKVLADPMLRRRYDAGLKLQALTDSKQSNYIKNDAWSIPVRCGLILADGHEEIGRFAVTKILEWQNITNSQGQFLVTSWDTASNSLVRGWV